MTHNDKVYLFYGNNHPFSNFYRSEFDMYFPQNRRRCTMFCGEQAIMGWKALQFEDEKTFEKILNCKTPYQCKSLGRQVKGFNDKEWLDNLDDLIDRVIDSKIINNSMIAATLLSTGQRTIAEASSKDKRWGIGLAENDPNALDPEKWRGDNLLGKGWMRARARWTEHCLESPAGMMFNGKH